MLLDLHTLFAVTVVANVLAAILLLFSWMQYRDMPALAIWGFGFLLGAMATTLFVARGNISDVFSIFVGNALLALGYGAMWGGTRSFVGRHISIPLAAAGLAVWLAAAQFDFIYHSTERRVLLMALIVGCYLLLSAWEFWRSRAQGLSSRLPIVAVLAIHATAFFVRIPVVGNWLADPAGSPVQLGWIALLALEVLFFVFCIAYLLGSVAHERVVLQHKLDANIDTLTGVANRRAFFALGENLVRRAKVGGQSAVLMLFDLDEFKKVNDRYGHPVGDGVLNALCAVAARSLQPADLFARVGGEEFACLLVDTSAADASNIAERIRAEFEASALELGAHRIRVTVSIGIASLKSGLRSLSELTHAADQALYRVKVRGRNRVEPAPASTVEALARAG